jgi:uncharacterized protein
MNLALRLPNRRSGLVQPLRRLFAAGLLLILLALTGRDIYAQNRFPPRTDRYINDFAHLLTSTDTTRLRTICSDLNRSKGIELVVVTINSIRDYNTADQAIEHFATYLFNTWGIGDRQLRQLGRWR